jgi:hypothetical protein
MNNLALLGYMGHWTDELRDEAFAEEMLQAYWRGHGIGLSQTSIPHPKGAE